MNGQFVTSGGFNSNEILRGSNSDKLKLFYSDLVGIIEKEVKIKLIPTV